MDLDATLALKVAHGHQSALSAAIPLDRAVADFLSVKGPAFTNLFAAKIRLLLSRDPDPREFELTVFDRVLLVVTRNGADLAHSASVAFFLRHYYNFHLDPNYTGQSVPNLDLELSVFDYETEVDDHQLVSRDNGAAPPSSSTHVNEVQTRVDIDKSLDPDVRRLLNTYEEACNEYLTVENLRDENSLKAAKYLRDTAENATVYLNETNICPEKLRDIHVMSALAKSVVEELSGGKVRKFDEGYQGDKSKEANVKYKTQSHFGRGRVRYRQPSPSPRTYTHRFAAYGDQSDRHSMPPAGGALVDIRRAHGHGRGTERRADSPIQDRTYSRLTEEHCHRPGHRELSPNRSTRRAEGHDHRGGVAMYAQEGPHPHRGENYEIRSSHRSRSPKERARYTSDPSGRDSILGAHASAKHTHKGRGHSGIPYGYSADRGVDSYKPSRS